MKKYLKPVVGLVGVGVVIATGISLKGGDGQSRLYGLFHPQVQLENHISNATVPQQGSQAAQAEGPGLVSIHYEFHRLSRLASNQMAIWIEDEQGGYVKTLFVTSFAANGGYRARPEVLPEWRRAADWEHASAAEVKSVSRPAPQSGGMTVFWDGTDRNGKPVRPGTYTYKIEGNIEWSNRVLYSGKIKIGTEKATSTAVAGYTPAEAEQKGVLIDHVTADFSPGEVLDAAKQPVTTQTRGS